jgi:integrase
MDHLWRRNKNGNPITVPLCSQALRILKRRQKTATSDWVFPNPKGNASMCEPRRTWEEFKQTSGLSDITIHDLRRTLGSWMAMTGASLPVIASALGHKLEKSSVTAVYARLNNEPVRKAVAKAVKTMRKNSSSVYEDAVNSPESAKQYPSLALRTA